MNKNLLKSIMALHNDTNKDLAKLLGKSKQSISNKINEKGTEFTQGEIAKIKEKYNLTAEQVEAIFFG
jgi:antitoxin component HigA of HigAB toxin-antitoxin module